MKAVSYARIAMSIRDRVAACEGADELEPLTNALTQIVLARAEGARGLGVAIDVILVGLAAELEDTVT